MNIGVKHSLCLISMLSKMQPSESMPTKNSFEGLKSRSICAGSLIIGRRIRQAKRGGVKPVLFAVPLSGRPAGRRHRLLDSDRGTRQQTGMTRPLTRRRFTRALFTAAGAITASPAFLRGQNLNNKLNVAIIGSGGRGAANLESVSTENIVALCDVNANNLDAAAAKHPRAKKAVDFRRLFEHARDFDAVVVSTCEHTHAFATMLALQHGKHVYCEKPLTHNIWEARRIREAAAKAKVATQMGIQIHATENYRRVVELVLSGTIGPVREAHVWVSRAWGWQSEEDAKRHKDIVWVTERPAGAQPVPVGLDWDLWLGPA